MLLGQKKKINEEGKGGSQQRGQNEERKSITKSGQLGQSQLREAKVLDARGKKELVTKAGDALENAARACGVTVRVCGGGRLPRKPVRKKRPERGRAGTKWGGTKKRQWAMKENGAFSKTKPVRFRVPRGNLKKNG